MPTRLLLIRQWPCGNIRKKIKEYEALTKTFTRRIGDKTNQNKKEIEGPNQRKEIKKHCTAFPIEVPIKSQKRNNSRLCNNKKTLNQ